MMAKKSAQQKKNGKIANSKKQEDAHSEGVEVRQGIFKEFAADEIPGHNRSVLHAQAITRMIGAKVTIQREEWREGPGLMIVVRGKTEIEYKIIVELNKSLLKEFDMVIGKLLDGGDDKNKLLSNFCPLLIKWKVVSYDPRNRSYDRICIEPSQLDGPNTVINQMPHVMDQVACLALALFDDINTAKTEPKMGSLRRHILNNWRVNWLLNEGYDSTSHDELYKISCELKKIEMGG